VGEQSGLASIQSPPDAVGRIFPQDGTSKCISMLKGGGTNLFSNINKLRKTGEKQRQRSSGTESAPNKVINFYASKAEAALLKHIHLEDSIAGGSKCFLVRKPDGSSSMMKIDKGKTRVKKLVCRPRPKRHSRSVLPYQIFFCNILSCLTGSGERLALAKNTLSSSVADPGCLSRIRRFHPGSEFTNLYITDPGFASKN
jgi:hypothetical protein